MKYFKVILSLLLFVGILFLIFILKDNLFLNNIFKSGGYIGAFLFSFFNGFNIFVPIVSTSFIGIWKEIGLNTYILFFLITLGMSLADTITFYLGKIINKGDYRFIDKLKLFKKKHESLPLIIMFVWAIIIPLPNELIAIPLGILGYSFWKFFPVIFLGNMLFNILTFYGITLLFKLLS